MDDDHVADVAAVADEADADEVEAWTRTWTIGDYPLVGDLWASVGQELVAELDRDRSLQGRDVVDVACGHGTTALAAAGRGARVTGVDLTPRLLAEADRRAVAADLAVDFVQGDFHHLPTPDRAADVVTSSFGVFLSTRPTAAAGELARIVRPGGTVAITAWRRDSAFHDLADIIAEVADIPREELLAGRPDTAAWAERVGLEQILVSTGLEIEGLRADEVVLPVDSVDQLVALLSTASGPWINMRTWLESRDIDWDEVRQPLCQRWGDRMTPDGFPVTYGRALLRRP